MSPPSLNRTILLVDDSELDRELVEVALRLHGYEDFRHCSEPDEVIPALLSDPTLRLVISDIQMPGVDGIDLLRRIRSTSPTTEVILCSGMMEFDYALSALREGAFDYALKNSMTELGPIVDRAFRKIDADLTIAAVTGRLFLSYAREDQAVVEELARKLSRAGYSPWIDVVDLVGGEDWHLGIEKAIGEADFFLACMSTRSISKRGVVQQELRAALEIRKGMLDSDIYLIPLRLDKCSSPSSLARFQWVDYFEPTGWERLLGAIREGLRRRSSP